jgi:hypothetical protein
VGVVLLAGRNRFLAVGDGRHDLQVRAQAEQELQRLAEDLVVLDDDDPDRAVVAHGAGQ